MTRRTSFAVLVFLGLMVVIVTAFPPSRADRGAPGTAATASPTPSQEPLSGPDDFDVKAKLSADAGAKADTIEAQLGDRVQIVVTGRGPGSVDLGGLRTEQFEQGLPATFEIYADTLGTYPLVVVDDNRRIGALVVR